jgi:3-oxoacyl-(acyl-carrier-protein) synthase
MTAPHPEGEGARKAIENALRDAGVSPAEIDLVVTHGTATPDNDLAEIKALTQVFDPLPAFCSMKRTLGHTLAASGALEAVFAVKALEEGAFPGTGGFEQLDEAIGIAPVTAGRGKIRNVLKNSFGFGGNNATLILSAK